MTSARAVEDRLRLRNNWGEGNHAVAPIKIADRSTLAWHIPYPIALLTPNLGLVAGTTRRRKTRGWTAMTFSARTINMAVVFLVATICGLLGFANADEAGDKSR